MWVTTLNKVFKSVVIVKVICEQRFCGEKLTVWISREEISGTALMYPAEVSKSAIMSAWSAWVVGPGGVM